MNKMFDLRLELQELRRELFRLRRGDYTQRWDIFGGRREIIELVERIELLQEEVRKF